MFERTAWEEDEDGHIVAMVVDRELVRSREVEAASRAARELTIVAEAIEYCLDIEAALDRYGLLSH